MSDEFPRRPQDRADLFGRLANLEQLLQERRDLRAQEMQELWNALNNLRSAIAVTENERNHNTVRVTRIESSLQDLRTTMEKQFDGLRGALVTKERYQNVERIVYGLVAIILSSFVLAISTLLLK